MAINRAPVAVAGENQQVCTGDIVVLDGSKSSDAEGGVLRYAWDFGDGSGSEIVNPTKSYSKGATYPVTLTVRDDTGLGNGVSTDQIAIRVDQGPVASAGADILACAGTEVQFDGTGSTDIDGVVNSFTWDFGDGNTGGGETPSHIYERPGDYRAFLTIEGEKAGICSSTSTDEVEVKIIEGPGGGHRRAGGGADHRHRNLRRLGIAHGRGQDHRLRVGFRRRRDRDRRQGNASIRRAGHLRRLADAPEQLDLAHLPDRLGAPPDPGQRHAHRLGRRGQACRGRRGDGVRRLGLARRRRRHRRLRVGLRRRHDRDRHRGPPPLRGGRDLHGEAHRPRRGGPRQFVLGRRADGDGQPGAGAGDRWA